MHNVDKTFASRYTVPCYVHDAVLVDNLICQIRKVPDVWDLYVLCNQ